MMLAGPKIWDDGIIAPSETRRVLALAFSAGGNPKGLRMEIDMTVNFTSRRHYSGTMKSRVVYKGISSTSEGTIVSTWLAASCKK